jgi:hypothetical protein
MSFTGNEDHRITLQEASDWTSNYRAEFPNDIKAHFFGKSTIKSILDQTNCVGIRIYYALDDSGAKHLVIVGADADQNDLYNGVLAERALPCPPFCGSGSPLE